MVVSQVLRSVQLLQSTWGNLDPKIWNENESAYAGCIGRRDSNLTDFRFEHVFSDGKFLQSVGILHSCIEYDGIIQPESILPETLCGDTIDAEPWLYDL